MNSLRRSLGHTGVEVFPLGFGTGQIGESHVSVMSAERLLDEAVDIGVDLFDTADSYGEALERLRPWLQRRRHHVVLSAKASPRAWSRASIAESIDAVLERLAIESVDFLRLRTIPPGELERGEAVAALREAKQQGKARFLVYSGENDELELAIGLRAFDVVMTSVNLCDQRSARTAVPLARARGIGVIAKRPLANGPWRFEERPVGHYGEAYWERFRAMGLPPRTDWAEWALRFSAFSPGVDACLIGTSSAAHLRELVAAMRAGPLPDEERMHIEGAFAAHDERWRGLV